MKLYVIETHIHELDKDWRPWSVVFFARREAEDAMSRSKAQASGVRYRVRVYKRAGKSK